MRHVVWLPLRITHKSTGAHVLTFMNGEQIKRHGMHKRRAAFRRSVIKRRSYLACCIACIGQGRTWSERDGRHVDTIKPIKRQNLLNYFQRVDSKTNAIKIDYYFAISLAKLADVPFIVLV